MEKRNKLERDVTPTGYKAQNWNEVFANRDKAGRLENLDDAEAALKKREAELKKREAALDLKDKKNGKK